MIPNWLSRLFSHRDREPTPPLRAEYVTHDTWPEAGTLLARTGQPDGAYLDTHGPLLCRHCGRPWGGSLYIGRGVALGGYALHTSCYPLAVQVAEATGRLGPSLQRDTPDASTHADV